MNINPAEVFSLVIPSVLSGAVLVWAINALREWWRRPQLDVVTDPKLDPGCLVANVTEKGDRAMHARVRVRNKGRGTAKGATGYFVRLTVDGDKGQHVFEGEVVSASWSYRGHTPLDIPAWFDGFYLDVYALTADENDRITAAGLCGTDQGFLLHFEVSEMVRLTLDLVIAGDNFRPKRVPLLLTWDRTFDGLTIARRGPRDRIGPSEVAAKPLS